VFELWSAVRLPPKPDGQPEVQYGTAWAWAARASRQRTANANTKPNLAETMDICATIKCSENYRAHRSKKLDHAQIRWKRNVIPSHCLSVISAQTHLRLSQGKPGLHFAPTRIGSGSCPRAARLACADALFLPRKNRTQRMYVYELARSECLLQRTSSSSPRRDTRL
jgi:hypothetical protein